MSQIKDFNDMKIEKINNEIKELREAQHKATDELDSLLNRMDMRSANGIEATEEDIMEMFAAMGKVARANRKRHEACIKHPNYKPLILTENIEDKVDKVIHGDVIPAFVPEEELDSYFK